MLKVIIDCDPGQDDAIMLLMAFAAPEKIEILGICAVSGNVPLDKTQRNVRIISDLANRSATKVYAGCDRPLVKERHTAEHVHGGEGIDGMALFDPATPLQSQNAVDFMIETILREPANEVTIVATGPLTNVAAALVKEPNITNRIKKIVLMGGAMREGGNITPSAEFNIFVDPHAAQVVFSSGIEIVAMGLDVTHQVFINANVLERIKNLNSAVSDAAHGMLSFFGRYDSEKYGEEGAPLHDPCTIAYLIKPELFRLKSCNVRIETESELTTGHTAVDFWNVTGEVKNAAWAYDIDQTGFFDLLIECLGKFEH